MNDLVEHIRAVHFTVLVVALVLTAALQIEKKRPLERAASDAETILQMTERWDETSLAITDDLQRQTNELYKKAKIYAPTAQSSDRIDRPELGFYQFGILSKNKSAEANARVFISSPWIYFDGDKNGGTSDGMLSKWQTLTDFLDFWDRQRDGRGVFLPVILTSGTRSKDGAYCSLSPLKSSKFFGSSSQVFSSPAIAYQVYPKGSLWTVQPFIGNGLTMEKICEFGPVDTFPSRVDLARVFRSLNPQAAKWGNRNSASEFNELITVSKYLEDAPLANLAAALRDRANTDTERIELFQAKLPASAIPTYGSFVLLLCQFYLFAHLLELRRLIRTNAPSEWPNGYTGLYSNVIVFGVTLASITVFPLIPLVISSLQNAGWLRYGSALAGALSLLLGIGCSLILVSIRKLHEQPPQSSTWSSL